MPSKPGKEPTCRIPHRRSGKDAGIIEGKAVSSRGDLTDDDLDVAEGNYEEMIGRIKERTGESAEQIRQRLGYRRLEF